MTTRKSGLLGLVLGVAFLAACEPKSEVIVQPTPPDTSRTITLNLVPEEATLTAVGQTVQLVAVVSGTTQQGATFSSSNTSVATVNSTTGVVTAVANGTAVITAISTADNTARDASTIRVQISGPPQGSVATISIQSITQGGTLFPVNQQNIQGQIDVTVNADIPAGSNVQRLEVLVDNTVACTQTFSTTGGDISVDGSQVPVQVICSINTAAFNATTGAPTYANGTHRVSARLVTTTGTIAATVAQDLVFNNQNFISTNNLNLAAAWSRGCTTGGNNPGPGGLAPVGSLWCGGDLTITLLPVNYTGGTGNAIASYTVTLTTSGAGTNGRAETACSGVEGGIGDNVVGNGLPNCTAVAISRTTTTGTVTFPGSSLPTNSAAAGTIDTDISGVEDIVGLTITSITAGGQAGPVCINPNPATNPAAVCGTGFGGGSLPNQAVFANPLRVDNHAPRITSFNVTPAAAALNCAPQSGCFVNGTFSFSERTSGGGFFTTVDYGVDSQTATFGAGPSTGSLTTVTTGSQLAETQTPSLLLQAVTTDKLLNSRTAVATNVAGCTAQGTLTSFANATLVSPVAGGCAGAAAFQLFGVDLTAPTVAVAAGPADNSANAGNVYTFSFSDAGVGPSGFSTNPVRVKVERITAAGTVCLDPNGANTQVSCTTNSGFQSDDGVVTLPATNGYYRVSAFVVDEAGNQSTTIVRLTLIDTAPPTTGGVVAPSTITGGAAATFSASVQDNVDLGDVQAAVNYGAAGVTLGFPRVTIDAYGPATFTTSTNATVTIDQFIRSIETTTGAGRPSGAQTVAQTVQFDVRDAAGVVNNVPCPGSAQNCVSSPAQNIVANVNAGGAPVPFATSNAAVFASANAAHGNFLLQAPNPVTVCNNAPNQGAAGCPTNPTSTTLTATVTGQSGITANPFQRVNFYYQDPSNGRWQLIGTGSVSVTDNTVTQTRTFSYTIVWTPGPTFNAGNYLVMALGINANGDALMTNQQTVTVAVD